MRTSVVVALCLALPAPLGAQRVNEKTAEEICARFASFKPGPDARPTEADRKLVASNSLTPGSYFVERAKGKAEYDDWRRYCLVTGECNRELAMIFANGWGVKRDYDAATWFLCRANGVAAYEQWSMLGHIETMRTAGEPRDLLYCDHVTSGRGQLHCAQIAAEADEEGRTDRIAKVKQGLSAEASGALDGLVEALEAFAEAETGLKVFDEGGTGYAAIAVQEQEKVREEQLAAVERLANTRAPGCAPEALKAADAGLNESYRLARAVPPECIRCSDPKAEWAATLRDAQRAWIRYRDAFAAFYLARWKGKADPEALKREIVHELTTERSVQLAGINTD